MKHKKVLFIAGAVLVSLSLASANSSTVKAAWSDHLPAMGQKATESYDKYSFKIDGHRIPIYSGEVEYWRLPSPSLYRDVLEKLKANGFNTVTIYFDWGYHSPNKETYDFKDVRNIDKLLETAQQVGLYVIARPGPYINAETDAGGFPGWMMGEKNHARSSEAGYSKDYESWMSHIDPIIAKHQITNGGNVILYQIENEYWGHDTKYMQNIINKAHHDGINVLTFHNDPGGPWKHWSSGEGAPDIYAYDSYPGLGSDWPRWYKFSFPHSQGWAAKSPIFVAELGGGWFDPWNGQGYDKVRQQRNAAQQNIIDKAVIGEGGKMINYYMMYGGTNWGYLAFPGVYSSYDYGAAIHEDRIFGKKMALQKKIAYMMDAVEPLAGADNDYNDVLSTNKNIHLMRLYNPETKTQFYVVRHENTASTSNDTFTLPIKNGSFTKNVKMNLNGQDSKILPVNYQFGDNENLVYSTNEIFTEFSNGKDDALVLYAGKGDQNETAFKFDKKPQVKVLSGKVEHSWDNSTKTETFKNDFDGLAEVQVQKTDGHKLTLIFGSEDEMDDLWLQKTASGDKVLVKGGYLVKKAEDKGNTLALTGETDSDTPISVLAPAKYSQLSWNGQNLTTKKDSNGWLDATVAGPDKSKVQVPALTDWKEQDASPESSLHFDDSKWTKADKPASDSASWVKTVNNSGNASEGYYKLQTKTSLLGDDYGFHYGDLWLRGHFKATGNETGIKLNGETGNYGAYSVWLNGKFLGSAETGKDSAKEDTFHFKQSDLRKNGDNVVSVLLSNMGHEEDQNMDDYDRSARGLTEATLEGADKGEEINWKIQGAEDKEHPKDTVRGIYNVGGLYGERKGWYLPGMDDSSWKSVGSDLNSDQAGVKWYRTSFDLNFPQNYDVPVSLEFEDPSFMQDNAGKYRIYLYINGWNYGQYINDIGPEKKFYLPAGLLNQDGHNTLALGIWKLNNEPTNLGSVKLVVDGIYKTDESIKNVKAPTYTDLFGAQGGNSGSSSQTGNGSGSLTTNPSSQTNNGQGQSNGGSTTAAPVHSTTSAKAKSKRIRLTHNALVYNKKGHVVLTHALKKGKYIKAEHNGKVFTIKGKKFYQIGKNRYVKVANTKSGKYVAYKKARRILVLGKKGKKVTSYNAQGKVGGHVLAGHTYKVSGYRKNFWTKKSKKDSKAYKLSGKYQYVLSGKARLLK